MVFKCKICGGDLHIDQQEHIAVCEYCGVKQTIPNSADERIIALYDRANLFLRNNEYDKAESLFEAILNENKSDYEAHWQLVMCKYGVEYVVDPKTQKRIPTCHRTQATSIFSDSDYKEAISLANKMQQAIYQETANQINEIQKGILAVSKTEKPYDIFICYKETNSEGKRTQDSVIAEDIYRKLTNQGYNVFFSKITLEDKIGSEYEPYIYSALTSAKVMLVIGTSTENINSAWVKNEWGRYLALIKKGENKTIIPCFANMIASELPQELSHLQGQDINKIGFTQDLLRGLEKIFASSENKMPINSFFADNKKTIIATGVAVFIFVFGLLLYNSYTISRLATTNVTTTAEVTESDSAADEQFLRMALTGRLDGYPEYNILDNQVLFAGKYAVSNYSCGNDCYAGTYDDSIKRDSNYAYCYTILKVEFKKTYEIHKFDFQLKQDKSTRKIYLDSIRITTENGSTILNEQEANDYIKNYFE